MYGGTSKPSDDVVVAESWLPPIARWVVALFGGFYLFALALSTTPWDLKLTPTLRFFTQISALFPEAATHSLIHRVEAWSCERKHWEELDYRRWFPLRPDDKENRFDRFTHFYYKDEDVSKVLETWLVEHHNALADAGDGIVGRIGGIRIVTAQVPVPPTGEGIERFTWKPFSEYPQKFRKLYYQASPELRKEVCQ